MKFINLSETPIASQWSNHVQGLPLRVRRIRAAALCRKIHEAKAAGEDPDWDYIGDMIDEAEDYPNVFIEWLFDTDVTGYH